MEGSSGLDGRIRNTVRSTHIVSVVRMSILSIHAPTLTFLFSGVFGVSLAPAAILDASPLSLALGWLNEF